MSFCTAHHTPVSQAPCRGDSEGGQLSLRCTAVTWGRWTQAPATFLLLGLDFLLLVIAVWRCWGTHPRHLGLLGAVSSRDITVCAVSRILRETPASGVLSGRGGGAAELSTPGSCHGLLELKGSSEGSSSSQTPHSSWGLPLPHGEEC